MDSGLPRRFVVAETSPSAPERPAALDALIAEREERRVRAGAAGALRRFRNRGVAPAYKGFGISKHAIEARSSGW